MQSNLNCSMLFTDYPFVCSLICFSIVHFGHSFFFFFFFLAGGGGGGGGGG